MPLATRLLAAAVIAPSHSRQNNFVGRFPLEKLYDQSSLSVLHLTNYFQMEQMLLHMGNNCSRLREVKLFNCSVRSDTLVRLGEMCPNISSLSLIWFGIRSMIFLLVKVMLKCYYVFRFWFTDASNILTLQGMMSLVKCRNLVMC